MNIFSPPLVMLQSALYIRRARG